MKLKFIRMPLSSRANTLTCLIAEREFQMVENLILRNYYVMWAVPKAEYKKYESDCKKKEKLIGRIRDEILRRFDKLQKQLESAQVKIGQLRAKKRKSKR